jgi:hypothetical protein
MIELLEKGNQGTEGPNGAKLPQNDQELLSFLDTAVLEELPTELLVKLAAQLKDRRGKLFVGEEAASGQKSVKV